MYTYFNQSPKKHLENTKLVEVIESRGLKILRNIWTRWISMLAPFKRLLSEYDFLVIKMLNDVVLLIKLLPLISNFCVMWKLCWD
jgi:CRISPR/Cas system-associated endonuclease Cas3-HD